MKKLKIKLSASVIILMIAACTQTVNAQGAYVNIGLGYGLNAASLTFGDNISGTPAKHTLVKGSLGKGFGFGGEFGFMFNENVSAELGLRYLVGGKIETKYSSSSSGTPTYTTDETYSYKATMLRIMPGVKITGGKNIMPYAKFGLVLGTMGKITVDYSKTETGNTTDITNGTTEYKKGMALGFYGAFGIAFKLSDNMSLCAELMSINQSWAPSHSTITKSTYNGTDELAGMTTSEKETDYVNSYTESTTSDPESPSKSIKDYLPMSSLQINVGLHISFGK